MPMKRERERRGMRLLIVIPAWREEKALPPLLDEIAQTPGLEADVVVVDDGSPDATAAVARAKGVPVLELPLNLGVGGAIRTGYRYAVRGGYTHAVQVDADGQHRPADIARLVARMEETGADIVIGSRFAGVGDYEVHGPRAWAIRFLAALLSRLCGQRLTDTTSGFKLMNRRAFAYFAQNLPSEYLGDTIEALVMAKKAGLSIEEVGVDMRPRRAGESSHPGWRALAQLLRGVVAIAIAMTRPSVELPEEDADV